MNQGGLSYSMGNYLIYRFAPEADRDRKLIEVIKGWCDERLKGFDEIQINDFTSSWRDGYAINALILSYDNKLFNMDDVRNMRRDERIEHAMDIAYHFLNVPHIINPKDFRSEYLDTKNVVCYLMMLYLAICARSPAVDERKLQLNLKKLEMPAVSSASLASSPQTPQMQPNFLIIDPVDAKPAECEHPQMSSISEESQPVNISNKVKMTTTPERQPSPRRLEHRLAATGSHSIEKDEHFSRQSSASSQRSRKSRKSLDEIVSEYQLCLEQVMAWLREAEEQTNSLGSIEQEDVEVVKAQFKEHEQFMQSLTESQDSVGRVLHRGNVICQKLDDEQNMSLLSQLKLVNAKWERVREIAMNRQNLLLEKLNSLQIQQLEGIKNWMNAMEEEIRRSRSISLDVDEIETLIKEHKIIREKIENEQKIVQKLSTFLAVVDETETPFPYDEIEKVLNSIGERWMAICEWAENRARKLDDLPQLIQNYLKTYKNLSEWLNIRENEMAKLRPVSELKNEIEIFEQVECLQNLESALEAGHEDFISLSQLATEILSKFDDTSENNSAKLVREQIDEITQRWDTIVSNIDKYSCMLVKSGKADAKRPDKANSDEEDSSICTTNKITAEESEPNDIVEMIKPSTVQFTSFEQVGSVINQENCSDEKNSAKNLSPVDIFISNLQRVSDDLQPLVDWAYTFDIRNYSDDVRNIIEHCQNQLREIKNQESRVNELHAELDRLHNLDIDSKQLHFANEKFEKFTKKWSIVVTKISDTLNSLSARESFINSRDLNDENDRILVELQNFFDTANTIVINCAQISVNEREVRLRKLNEQILAQNKNIAFLEANHLDKTKVEMLKNRFTELKESMLALQEGTSLMIRLEDYLQRSVPPFGDIEQLTVEFGCGQELLEILKKIKYRENNMEKLEILSVGKHNTIKELLNRTKRWNEKGAVVQGILNEFTERFRSLKKDPTDLPELLRLFRKLRSDYENSRTIQKDYGDLADETLSYISCNNIPNRDKALNDVKNAIVSSNNTWKEFEEEIDENINILEKEHKKLQQKAIRNFRQHLDDLKAAISASYEATDAEEFSEHLDVSLFILSFLYGIAYPHLWYSFQESNPFMLISNKIKFSQPFG